MIDESIEILNEKLSSVEIKSDIHGRPKHFYSIYKKMKSGKEFDELYDLIAVRVIVKEESECYMVLGLVHNHWKPVSGRFKDYIAVPKANGYQSIHTTVVGPEGRFVEIQIRTDEMHRIAEEGVAAHWSYKEKNKIDESEKEFNVDFAFLYLGTKSNNELYQGFVDLNEHGYIVPGLGDAGDRIFGTK